MLRKILGVVTGYVVMNVTAFMTYSGLYLAIGADRAYEPGTYEVSLLWIAAILVLGFIAAVVAGYLCKRIAGDLGTVVILAGIVVGLGIAAATAISFNQPKPKQARSSDVSNYEAMKYGRKPLWVEFAIPIVGFAGILVGGGAVGRKIKE